MVNDYSLIKELCEKNIQLNNGKHRLITIFLHNQGAYSKLRQEGKISTEAHRCLSACKSLFEKAESEISIEYFIVSKYEEIIHEYNVGHIPKKTDKFVAELKANNTKMQERNASSSSVDENKKTKKKKSKDFQRKNSGNIKKKIIIVSNPYTIHETDKAKNLYNRNNTYERRHSLAIANDLYKKTKSGLLKWKKEKNKKQKGICIYTILQTDSDEDLKDIKVVIERNHNRQIIGLYKGEEELKIVREKMIDLYEVILTSIESFKDTYVDSNNEEKKIKYTSPYERLRKDYESSTVYSSEIKSQQDEEEKANQRRKAEQKERERCQMEEEKKQEYLSGLPMISAETFLLRSNAFRCNYSNHNIKDINAVVTIVSRKRDEFTTRLYRITAGFCKECNVYFIQESAYERLKTAGIPICRVADRDKYFKSVHNNVMRLADESILMQYGYNVNQNEGLTEQMRHKILAMLIDNKIMSKNQIISYLDFFISQRQSNPVYELAISKWAKDRDFVSEYRFGEYGFYVISEIQK